MKTSKILSILLILVMCISVFAGCGATPAATPSNSPADSTASSVAPSDTPKAEQIELEFWTINLKKNFSDYIQGMIDQYQANNPNVKINWVDVPGADVTKKVITSLSSNDVPDVVNETTFGLATLRSYDVLLPLSDYADKTAFDPYIDGLLASCTFNGQIMAIPWYNGGPWVGFINADIYSKAGLDPNNPPKTIDQLLENGKIIHEKLPDVYGSNDFPVIQVFQAEGLPVVSEDQKTAVFNSDEHVKLIQKFVDAYKNGSLAPGCIGKDDRNYQQAFNNAQTGQLGWWFASELNNWEKNTPDILKSIKVVPAVEGKSGAIAIKDSQLFMVPKKTEHPKEAVDLALFVTNAKNQLDFCKIVPIFGSTKETLNDQFFKDIATDTLAGQARKLMVESASKLCINQVSSLPNSQTLVDIYNEEVRAAMTGTKTVKEALDAAVAAWEPILKK